jgi:hypothetical protein
MRVSPTLCSLMIAIGIGFAPLAAHCAEPAAPPPAEPGTSKESPLEVCMPEGEYGYLERLTCPDGTQPRIARGGSAGPRNKMPEKPSEEFTAARFREMLSGTPLKPGEVDYHIVDAFNVVCGTQQFVLYLDMYHCQVDAPTTAPYGLKLRALAP